MMMTMSKTLHRQRHHTSSSASSSSPSIASKRIAATNHSGRYFVQCSTPQACSGEVHPLPLSFTLDLHYNQAIIPVFAFIVRPAAAHPIMAKTDQAIEQSVASGAASHASSQPASQPCIQPASQPSFVSSIRNKFFRFNFSNMKGNACLQSCPLTLLTLCPTNKQNIVRI